jgi:DNA helicase-2/ATP-dependent DNA helicase PcrA
VYEHDGVYLVHSKHEQTFLESTPAAAFYVAATRAKQSLAIIIDKPGSSKLPEWVP